MKIAYETIAYAAETLVFIFLGIGIFAFEHPTDKVGFGAILIGVIIFGLSRLLNIFLVTCIVNRTRNDT
jgi:NhaP-type Na+/H+ or K+/H+ antiporter